jgi:hypothetical protein
MGELLTAICTLGGAIVGGYIGVRLAVRTLEVNYVWMKEMLTDHVKDREIHHTHLRSTDSQTGMYPQYKG